MAAHELEIYPIGDKQYVTLYDSAKWLKMPIGELEGQIAAGKLELIQIESRRFIELEDLKTYAEKRKRPKSGWDRVDEWRMYGG